MILFVDETENEDFFIVTGLLAHSKEEIDLAYKRFKKSIKNYPVSPAEKQLIFGEFKSVLLDRRYQRIKLKMLKELNSINETIIYSCYIKKRSGFPQLEKEKTYILLLNKIVSSIDHDIEIVFDTFNKLNFERKIIESVSGRENVIAISAQDSQLEPGLQFVDNLCSILRLKKSYKDTYNFYAFIEQFVIEV